MFTDRTSAEVRSKRYQLMENCIVDWFKVMDSRIIQKLQVRLAFERSNTLLPLIRMFEIHLNRIILTCQCKHISKCYITDFLELTQLHLP